ncbi:MAG: hypothetical protein COU31_03090 [Candidatus Magasanikbacteria bacterium CG10_big_fil_rev_8_21_14_0_10_40_10]|uniref:DEAD/DEAH box helicase n=1 Tax=Candidatus Magasanikbacteria bacterium CG10_big_fil_rev_8_21_14_0_10_40_10 TaxID=1974648 RepID=A0A2M6W3N9_9BACT|nr:MAG: hypothetical protein COU31_03090 [Candidatus Magasanikbacteria bacterium CG10_big_fil_rev_8_21_14_0_10_40_10]
MWPIENRVNLLYMTQKNTKVLDFKELGISQEILAVLERLKFAVPTPIQHQCIPVALEGKDIVGIAQTGTGKTLAFGVPMIQMLRQNQGQGLILLPTRELALQVDEVLQKIGQRFGLRTAVIIGGASSYRQLQAVRRNPHILVSTPGRLIDHLQQKNINLNKVKMVVLDEADRMFDIGFLPAIKQILSLAPKDRQTMMFSATMPKEIAQIASQHMKMPLRIEVAPSGTAAKNVEQEVFFIPKESKIRLLDKILADNVGTVLVFSRTKHGAKKITANVRAMGHTAAEIHSNKSLSQRKAALQGFKSGRYRVLVATDIASRGIDVNDISFVINYDLPDNIEDYVHRIGRTGRAEKYGKAISFATPDERGDIRQIERLIKKTIPILALPELPPRRVFKYVEKSFANNRQFGNGRRFDSGRQSGSGHPRRFATRGFMRQRRGMSVARAR